VFLSDSQLIYGKTIIPLSHEYVTVKVRKSFPFGFIFNKPHDFIVQTFVARPAEIDKKLISGGTDFFDNPFRF
jgi:hypothetical protein